MMRRILLGVLILAACVLGIHAYSLEGIDGWFFSRFPNHFPQDTQYAPGFTDRAFRRIHKGMTEADVARALPAPLDEVWTYPAGRVSFAHDVVDDVDADLNVRTGETKADVLRHFGPPAEKSFVYSRRPTDVSYHVRAVIFRNGRVTERIAEFYVD